MFTVLSKITDDTDGAITVRTSNDFTIASLRGKRLKKLIALKRDTNEESLTMCGQFQMEMGGYFWPLGPADLFDEYEGLIWEGDMYIPQSANLRLLYSNGDALDLQVTIDVLAVYEDE